MNYKHYIKTDSKGYIIKSFTDAFEQPEITDILIEEGGRHYNLNLYTTAGIPRLIFDDSGIRECTNEEIDAYRTTMPKYGPSLEERNRADIDYLLMLQGEGI